MSVISPRNHADPLLVACPISFCEARKGEPCVSHLGVKLGVDIYHGARCRSADAQAQIGAGVMHNIHEAGGLHDE